MARVVHSDTPAHAARSSRSQRAGQPAVRATSTGASAATSSACRPTARSATSGSAGSATPRSSPGRASYNRDVAAFFTKWLDDVADAQLPSGAFPDVAPRLNLDRAGAPAWGDAGIIVPWTLYRRYGDAGSLERHCGAMTARWTILERDNPDYLRGRALRQRATTTGSRPGEDRRRASCSRPRTGRYDAALMAEIAEALGRPTTPRGYRGLRSKIGAAFDRRVRGGRRPGRLGHRRPLYAAGAAHDLMPDELRAGAPPGIWSRTIEATDWHLTTGFVGVGLLLPGAERDRPHRRRLPAAAQQDTFPSWGYMIRPRRDDDLGALGRLDRASAASRRRG